MFFEDSLLIQTAIDNWAARHQSNTNSSNHVIFFISLIFYVFFIYTWTFDFKKIVEIGLLLFS